MRLFREKGGTKGTLDIQISNTPFGNKWRYYLAIRAATIMQYFSPHRSKMRFHYDITSETNVLFRADPRREFR